MTKIAHTPGPLNMDGFGNIRAEGHPSLIAFGGVALGNRSDPEVKANDDRLFALWNACEGIANPDVVPEAIAALRGVRWRSADRDNMEFVATITYSQMDKLRAILAKLEGRS